MIELTKKNKNLTSLLNFLEEKISNSRRYSKDIVKSEVELIAVALKIDIDDVAFEIERFDTEPALVMECVEKFTGSEIIYNMKKRLKVDRQKDTNAERLLSGLNEEEIEVLKAFFTSQV